MRKGYISRLSDKQRYLQVALNSSREDARAILSKLPQSDRIIIEAGTPLIKRYGVGIIRELYDWSAYGVSDDLTSKTSTTNQLAKFGLIGMVAKSVLEAQPSSRRPKHASSKHTPYIVADMKTIDRGETEVEMCARAGASAVIAMGSAPIETLNAFIASCEAFGMDAMIDMMNVEFPLTTLRALKKQPRVVVLHRGVDEERDNRQKILPLHEIRRIKGAYDILIAVAGGDTPREVQSAAFNDADIVVIWKSVYEQNGETLELVENFLKTIK